MGKKLIIKGADFSTNGIPAVASRIKGVTTSATGQSVTLSVPSDLTTAFSYEMEFCELTLQKVNGQMFFHTGPYYQGDRTLAKVGHTDGRVLFFNRGKRQSTLIVPTIGEYHTVSSSYETTVYDETSSENSQGSLQTDVSINGTIVLFPTYEDKVVDAGQLIISKLKILSADKSEVYADYVAAQDRNDRVCFWDLMTDTLCYADSGELVAITE